MLTNIFYYNSSQANFKGYTGAIRFDAEGRRSDFEAEIIELTTNGLIKIGIWNQTAGLKIKRPLVDDETPEDAASLTGKHFYVISVLVRCRLINSSNFNKNIIPD